MNFGLAFGLSLFAGLSTGLGGLLVALKRNPSDKFLAASLGFSAGVMVYICLLYKTDAADDAISV